MRTIFYLSFILLLSIDSYAQIDRGGQPLSWSLAMRTSSIPVVTGASIDLESLAKEDEVVDKYKEAPFRFGVEHEVSIDFLDIADYDTYKHEDIRRLRIHCPEALSISLLFDAFYIPEGGRLFIYNSSHSELKGAFTEESNTPSRIFPVGLVQGDDIIVEYNGPSTNLELHISQLVHGYRAILDKLDTERGPFGNSGPCNINVNCPQGENWQEQKRSVALIVQGGNALCSGALVNNTQNDGHPYFLTANHCLGNPNNWVYYFNHESATCTGNSGPQNQSISGGTLLAQSANSDFALIELNQSPPESFQPYYAGWDKSDALNVTDATCIHHPSGDLKKISIENDAPYKQIISATQVWWIDEWEEGVTEGGSSGSPLFNQNGRIIGQLYGGQAACAGAVNNGQYDYFGRFGISWNGVNASVRLKDWLDPGNISTATLNGYGPYDISYALDAAVSGFVDVPSIICQVEMIAPKVKLRNNGLTALTSVNITYSYNGVDQEEIQWSGNLVSGTEVQIALEPFTVQEGTNNIELAFNDPNGSEDENPANNTNLYSFNVLMGTPALGVIEVRVFTDQYAEETSWTVKDAGGNLIASSGALNNSQLQIRTVSLPADGCYEFTINDTYGDGICCEFGSGNYELRDYNGSILASGAEFESSESVLVSISDSYLGLPVPELEIGIFPSVPIEGESIHLQTTIDYDYMDLNVIDAMGRLVYSAQIAGINGTEFTLPSLAKGAYFLEFKRPEFRKITRILLK